MSAYSAYRCQQLDQGLPSPPPLRYQALTLDLFSLWYDTHQPDLILSDSGDVLQLLSKRKLVCPKVVAFMNLNLPPKSPTFAGIAQNSERVGELAIELLANQVNLNTTGQRPQPTATLVSGFFRPGPTFTKRQ